MAEIDKTLNEAPQGVEEEISLDEVKAPMEVELETTEEDIVNLGPSPEDTGDGFADNLAENIPEETLAQISNELRSQFSVDQTSRKDWEQSYIKGLDLLGFHYSQRPSRSFKQELIKNYCLRAVPSKQPSSVK